MGELTDDQVKEIQQKYGIHLENNTKRKPEKQPVENRSKLIMTVSMIGAMIVGGATLYMLYGSGMSYAPQLTLIMFIAGMFAFIPFGAIFGWIFGDKYQYVKSLRFITHKDYGLVNMVRKDGRTIEHFIKNLSDSIIERKGEIWHITRDRIYNDKGSVSYNIPEEKIKHHVGIPEIYLDVDSFTPVDFYKDKMNFLPKDITPPLKAWVTTKELEAIGGIKKQLVLFVLIAVVLAGVSAGLGWINHTALNDEIMPVIKNIPALCSQSGGAEIITNAPVPQGEIR